MGVDNLRRNGKNEQGYPNWRVETLNELTVKIGSGITPRGGSRVYKPYGRVFLRSQNVDWGKLLLDGVAFIDDKTHHTFDSTELHVGDVLLNITGASIGRAAVATSLVVGGNVNQHVCIIRVDPKRLDPGYLCYVLLSQNGQRQIESFQAGGNRQGLNFGQIGSISLPVPEVTEQTAIATALTDIDDLIQNLEQLIEKKKQIKQGAMQDLLTGKRRLPGFKEPWVKCTIGDIGSFLKGSGIRRDEVRDSGLGCIRYGEIYTTHNEYVKRFESFIGRNAASQSTALRQGDLLFAGSGETAAEIGKCVAIVSDEEAYAGGDIVILRPGTDVDSLFLGFQLNCFPVVRQKARMGQGDAVVHISARHLREICIILPPTKIEQTAIADSLKKMDEDLTAHQLLLSKYIALKQAMMQVLLTGQIRLI
ncbi:MAG: restriction endonuclease subunit S [Bacteroidetes bacterium]|nr:restriction endonuclease subunit S [Bacteroidota bacterium]